MTLKLRELEQIDDADQAEHRIFALVKNDRSPAYSALIEWAKSSPDDYEQILISMKLVGSMKSLPDSKHVQRDRKGRDVYELKAAGRNARLMFFFTDWNGQHRAAVLLWNSYWKTSSSIRQQEAAFDRAAEMKEEYEKQFSQGSKADQKRGARNVSSKRKR